MGSTLARTGEERDHVYTLTGGALRLVRTLADGRRQINGFVLPGDYLGLSGSDHHRYDIEAIADSRVCRVALPQMKAQLRGPLRDIADGIVFTEDAVNHERGVVLAEIARQRRG